MWRFQFLNLYDFFVFGVAILSLLASIWTGLKEIPLKEVSPFKKTLWKYNWSKRSDPMERLSESVLLFLKNISSEDEVRLKIALSYAVFVSSPNLVEDLVFRSKVSSSSAIIPFPSRGPYLGNGQFSTPQEMEFLIDLGLIRENPVFFPIGPSQTIEFYRGQNLIQINASQSENLKAYALTALGRELLIASANETVNVQGFLRRMESRVLAHHPGVQLLFGEFDSRRERGQSWIEPKNLKVYSEK